MAWCIIIKHKDNFTFCLLQCFLSFVFPNRKSRRPVNNNLSVSIRFEVAGSQVHTRIESMGTTVVLHLSGDVVVSESGCCDKRRGFSQLLLTNDRMVPYKFPQFFP
jgi:hypothetical protein